MREKKMLYKEQTGRNSEKKWKEPKSPRNGRDFGR